MEETDSNNERNNLIIEYVGRRRVIGRKTKPERGEREADSFSGRVRGGLPEKVKLEQS